MPAVKCKILDQLSGGIFCVNECGLDKEGKCDAKHNVELEDCRAAFGRFTEWKKDQPGTEL